MNKFNQKTILVTGCCGMIGFATVQLLLQNNYKVIGIDCFEKFNFSHHLYQKDCVEILQAHPHFTFLDLNLAQVESLFFNNLPDAIIHLGAFAGITFSFLNPEDVLHNNQKSLLLCLELSRKNNIPIFFASSSVYGNQDNATSENTTLTPLNIYALSKKHNEDTAKMYHDLYGITAIGLRFFTVY